MIVPEVCCSNTLQAASLDSEHTELAALQSYSACCRCLHSAAARLEELPEAAVDWNSFNPTLGWFEDLLACLLLSGTQSCRTTINAVSVSMS